MTLEQLKTPTAPARNKDRARLAHPIDHVPECTSRKHFQKIHGGSGKLPPPDNGDKWRPERPEFPRGAGFVALVIVGLSAIETLNVSNALMKKFLTFHNEKFAKESLDATTELAQISIVLVVLALSYLWWKDTKPNK